MTSGNKIFRAITLGLQITAIAAYFIIPLILGNRSGLLWLILGVLHTAIFAAVFFRNARTRTALSIILMIVTILWCLFLLLLGLFIYILELNLGPMSSLSLLFTYIAASLLAIIFALAGPRRFPKEEQAPETPPELAELT